MLDAALRREEVSSLRPRSSGRLMLSTTGRIEIDEQPMRSREKECVCPNETRENPSRR